jgi:hypothetical protein
MTIRKMANTCFALTCIFSLALLGSCSNDNADDNLVNDQYLLIPDNHFEQLLIDQGIDTDGTLNGQMLQEDAEKVERLDINLNSHFGDIEDLTGVEGFVNITFLSAIGQNLQEIDLCSNTKLDTLYLQNNNLKTIDLSKNTRLILVNVLQNELNAVSGLEQATRLKFLNLSYNYFEGFSITNESLEHLLISNNVLTSFSSSGVPNLKSILLTTNQLGSVDLSSNPSLETLVISDNSLEGIHLADSPNLLYFYASSNMMTQLDVSQNPALIDLRVDRNPNLSCIKIKSGQEIPTVTLSEYQKLNEDCE